MAVSREDASIWDYLTGKVKGTPANNSGARNRELFSRDLASLMGRLDPREARRRQLRSSSNRPGTDPRSPVQDRPSTSTGGPGVAIGAINALAGGGAGESVVGGADTPARRALGGADSVGATVDQWANNLRGMMGGGGAPAQSQGGGIDDLLASIGGSYDAEIAALRRGGSALAGLTGQLIGGINSAAGAAQGQIGGFYDYAAGQAQAGRPVIAESHQTAGANVDATYDTLAGSMAAMPGQFADIAREAGGSGAGSTVADRVATAAAPFAAAGESSRASAQANLQQHSTAGQDYLTQLAAAAPSEAAMAQSAVAARAAQAVTSAQMALAEQRAAIETQVARTEGAKQRALAEYSADVAGDTFERQMRVTNMMLDQEYKRLRNTGMQRDLEVDMFGDPALTTGSGMADFDAALRNAGQSTQRFATDQLLPALSLVSQLPSAQRIPEEAILQRLLPRGQAKGSVGPNATNRMASTLDELVERILMGDDDVWMSMPEGVDLDAIRRGLRQTKTR